MLASAHLHIQKYVDIYQRFVAGDMNGSRDNFMLLESVIQHVFAEPAPAAIKWWLTQQEIIAAEQLRLPLMPLSDQVKQGLLNSIVS
jgi:4-hydroxy-tetrahydrodipicolinate synthase